MLSRKYEYSIVSPGGAAYQEYLALRHEVFCDELKRVPSSGRRLGGLAVESDEFDVHSVHVLCRSLETGAAVGCSRLILPGPKGLNVTARYQLSRRAEAAPARIGEIGRLALSSRLRRHRCASSVAGCGSVAGDGVEGVFHGGLKRDGPTVALGLYREIFRLAGSYGISHCYAAMEPALARLLNRMGFPFHEAGPLNSAVQPARQPYLIGAHAARAGLASRNSCLYQFMFGMDEAQSAVPAAAWTPAPAGRDDRPAMPAREGLRRQLRPLQPAMSE